jgi:hypothetical protein
LGIVLYELFAGSVPMGAARPLEQVRRDIPKRYARAVMRAIASHPEDRWPSLQAFFGELVRQQHKTPWAAAAVAVGVVAAVAVGAGLYLYQDRNSDQGTAQTQTPGPSTDPASGVEPANQGTAKPVGANPVATGVNATTGGNLTPLNDTRPENPNVLVPVVGPATANVSAGANSPPVVGSGEVGVKTPDRPPSNPSTGSSANTPARGPTQEQLAAMANASKQREECVAQCSRDESECKRINERARRDCSRSTAFGGTATSASVASCNAYGPERCYGPDRDACIRNNLNQRAECLRSAGRRQGSDCTAGQREADQRCLEVRQECAASCR